MSPLNAGEVKPLMLYQRSTRPGRSRDQVLSDRADFAYRRFMLESYPDLTADPEEIIPQPSLQAATQRALLDNGLLPLPTETPVDRWFGRLRGH